MGGGTGTALRDLDGGGGIWAAVEADSPENPENPEIPEGGFSQWLENGGGIFPMVGKSGWSFSNGWKKAGGAGVLTTGEKMGGWEENFDRRTVAGKGRVFGRGGGCWSGGFGKGGRRMKRFWRAALVAVLAAGMWLAAGCEEHDSWSEWEVHGRGGTRESAHSVSGTWHGKAGTGQGGTTLRLQQDGTSLSGYWTWGTGDTRRCSGYRDGWTIYLWDTGSNGDSWQLVLSDDGLAMSGSASKHGGGGYALAFTR